MFTYARFFMTVMCMQLLHLVHVQSFRLALKLVSRGQTLFRTEGKGLGHGD